MEQMTIARLGLFRDKDTFYLLVNDGVDNLHTVCLNRTTVGELERTLLPWAKSQITLEESHADSSEEEW